RRSSWPARSPWSPRRCTRPWSSCRTPPSAATTSASAPCWRRSSRAATSRCRSTPWSPRASPPRLPPSEIGPPGPTARRFETRPLLPQGLAVALHQQVVELLRVELGLHLGAPGPAQDGPGRGSLDELDQTARQG